MLPFTTWTLGSVLALINTKALILDQDGGLLFDCVLRKWELMVLGGQKSLREDMEGSRTAKISSGSSHLHLPDKDAPSD